MRRAVELAACGLGTTSPNPVVGCVILDREGQPVGEGFHELAGGPHAEVRALTAAGERSHGGTAVVTLEPCAHAGRTPPCTDALVRAGISRVVFAVDDPNPVAAGGAAVLSAAGVEVESGLLASMARTVNEAWLTASVRGRPHVTWKYATTLDGRVAAADGTSQWITSAPARADGHRLRAQSDAVVVGSGTVRADDPHLAARMAAVRRQPLRVVVDSNAQISPAARVLDDAAPTLVAVAADTDGSALGPGVDVLKLPRADRGLDLHELLEALRVRDVVSVLLEGGPTLAGSFLAAGLVDKVVGYIAPALIGGAGRTVLVGPGAETIADTLRLRIDEVTPVGPDLRITARPINAGEEPTDVHRHR